MSQVAHARTAVLLRHGDAEQAHLAELLPHVHGEGVGRVDLGGTRRQLGVHEGAYLVAQHVDGFAEGEVEAGVGHGTTFVCLVVVRFAECYGSDGQGIRSLRPRWTTPDCSVAEWVVSV